LRISRKILRDGKKVKPIKPVKVKTEGMKESRETIPDKVLKEILPKKLKRYGASEKVSEVADGHKDTVEKN